MDDAIGLVIVFCSIALVTWQLNACADRDHRNYLEKQTKCYEMTKNEKCFDKLKELK